MIGNLRVIPPMVVKKPKRRTKHPIDPHSIANSKRSLSRRSNRNAVRWLNWKRYGTFSGRPRAPKPKEHKAEVETVSV